MSDENKPVRTVRPSDTTIADNYVALKPGNYKVRQSLEPFKGTNLTDGEILHHSPGKMSLGVGETNAAVFIYRQKTIEIIGKVYHGNRLVKPGVYSQFEKLRYLNEDEVYPLEEGVYSHRSAYNQQVSIDNDYVKQTQYDEKTFIEYLYVDFNDQMRGRHGNSVYPIPIVNGKLTIYPDGSFETEGVVIRSTDGALVDKVGYLGDSENYGSVLTFYNDVTKDDVNPTQVWQKISENENGSITYGPIEANIELRRDDWLRLPNNIIPINDGKVVISDNGWISIEGTVITDEGYPIGTPRLHYNDLFKLDPEGKNVSEYLDRSMRYNPKVGDTIINIVGNPEEVPTYRYRYHFINESYSIYDTERGKVAQYRPMPGWDNFTSNVISDENKITFIDKLLKFSDFYYNQVQDKSLNSHQYYPFEYQHPVGYAGCIIYPKMYLVNEMDKPLDTKYYTLIDHYLFHPDYPYYTLQGGNYDKETKTYLSELYTTPRLKENNTYQMVKEIDVNSDGFILNDNEVISRFIPYFNGYSDEGINDHVGEVTFTQENDETFIEIKGTVIWRRNNQYYTLDEGKVPYITDWPDIKEDENGKIRLFSSNGYFTDEPIFFKATRDRDDDVGYTLGNIDGLKREEPGLFSLIRRNVTTYLTPWDKYLIDNVKAHAVISRFDKDSGKVKVTEKYLFNTPFTFRDTNIHLRYKSFKWKNVLPRYYDNVKACRFGGIEPRALSSQVDYNPLTKTLFLFNTVLLKLKNESPNGVMIPAKTALSINTEVGIIQSISDEQLNAVDWQGGKSVDHFDNLLNPPILDKPESISLPKTISLSANGELKFVAGVGPKHTTLFYRQYNDNRLFTGSVETNHLGYFEIPVPKIYVKYGYTEVWADEPFSHQGEMNIVHYRIGESVPVEVLEKETITLATRYIRGKSEPSATISIYNPDGELVGQKKATRSGVWRAYITQPLTVGTYTVYQKGIWKHYNNQHDSFHVNG